MTNWRQARLSKTAWDKRTDVALVIGKDVFTRDETRRLFGAASQATVNRLNKIVQRWRPESILELARRKDAADFFNTDVPRVGEETVALFMEGHRLQKERSRSLA